MKIKKPKISEKIITTLFLNNLSDHITYILDNNNDHIIHDFCYKSISNFVIKNKISNAIIQLLDNGKFDIILKDDVPAIYELCRLKLSDAAIRLLDLYSDKDIMINYTSSGNETALGWTCYNSLSNVAIKILSRNDVDINIRENINGFNTPIKWACVKGLSDVAMKLLTYKNINLYDVSKYNFTVLMLACKYNLNDVALEILNHKNININQINNKNETALSIANSKELYDVLTKIMDHDEFVYNGI
jgi:hypothetical protein